MFNLRTAILFLVCWNILIFISYFGFVLKFHSMVKYFRNRKEHHNSFVDSLGVSQHLAGLRGKSGLSEKKPHVVQIIHQSWKSSQIPDIFRGLRASWTEICFKKWRHVLWTDWDNLQLISTRHPWFLPVYNALTRPINKADVARYFYMYEYGGIYTDLDNECLRPFEHLLANYSIVLGAMKGSYMGVSLHEGYVQNSFMYSRPRQRFWLEFLQDIAERFNVNVDVPRGPEGLTGPVALSTFIGQERFLGRIDDRKLHIYPPHIFNPISWKYWNETRPTCKRLTRMTEHERMLCRKFYVSKQSCYVLQYHAHSWE